jgi:hypothetical protein
MIFTLAQKAYSTPYISAASGIGSKVKVKTERRRNRLVAPTSSRAPLAIGSTASPADPFVAAGAMASGGLAAASEVAVVFLIRPVLAIAFVFTLILLGTPPLPLLPSLGYLLRARVP